MVTVGMLLLVYVEMFVVNEFVFCSVFIWIEFGYYKFQIYNKSWLYSEVRSQIIVYWFLG